MSRYIDADEVLRGRKPLEFNNSFEQGKVWGWNQAINYIGNFAPTADVVEVVRCKDCVYWEQATNNSGNCNRAFEITAYRSDYCSYGERREDAEIH